MFTDAKNEEPVGRLIPATLSAPKSAARGRAVVAAPLGEGSKQILTFPRSTGSTDGCMSESPTGKVIANSFFAAAPKPPTSRRPRCPRAFQKARAHARNDQVFFPTCRKSNCTGAGLRAKVGMLGEMKPNEHDLPRRD